MLTRNLRSVGKEAFRTPWETGARSWTSPLHLNFYSPVEAPRRGEGPERQLVAQKQVVSVARVCKGLDCNSRVSCEAGCDHFR